MTDSNLQLRAEHDAVLSSVASRSSTVHFAHAAVCGLIGVVSAITALKLWLDYGEDLTILSIPTSVFSAAMIVYAIVRFLLGRRALGTELATFAKLQKLREALGFNDARAQLP